MSHDTVCVVVVVIMCCLAGCLMSTSSGQQQGAPGRWKDARNITERNITEQNVTEQNITEHNITEHNITERNITDAEWHHRCSPSMCRTDCPTFCYVAVCMTHDEELRQARRSLETVIHKPLFEWKKVAALEEKQTKLMRLRIRNGCMDLSLITINRLILQWDNMMQKIQQLRNFDEWTNHLASYSSFLKTLNNTYHNIPSNACGKGHARIMYHIIQEWIDRVNLWKQKLRSWQRGETFLRELLQRLQQQQIEPQTMKQQEHNSSNTTQSTCNPHRRTCFFDYDELQWRCLCKDGYVGEDCTDLDECVSDIGQVRKFNSS